MICLFTLVQDKPQRRSELEHNFRSSVSHPRRSYLRGVTTSEEKPKPRLGHAKKKRGLWMISSSTVRLNVRLSLKVTGHAACQGRVDKGLSHAVRTALLNLGSYACGRNSMIISTLPYNVYIRIQRLGVYMRSRPTIHNVLLSHHAPLNLSIMLREPVTYIISCRALLEPTARPLLIQIERPRHSRPRHLLQDCSQGAVLWLIRKLEFRNVPEVSSQFSG